MSEQQVNRQRARLQLLLLMLIPIAVVLLATFVFYTRIGMPEGTRNKGMLIIPPLQLHELKLADMQGKPQQLADQKDVWTFMYVSSSDCQEACQHQLWETRQTRTALGKYQDNVRRLWLITDGSLSNETVSWLKQEHPDLQLLGVNQQEWQAKLGQSPQGLLSQSDARFYLVDPRGFVMMYYRPTDSYKDVITDMKFLLKGVE